MPRLISGLTLGLLLAAAQQGCGATRSDSSGEAGAEPGEFSTTVPGDTRLDQLSDSEAQAVCLDGYGFVSSSTLQDDACQFAAVVSAGFLAAFSPDATDDELEMACQEATSNCLADEETIPGEPGADESACDLNQLENCDANVAQYGTCLQDSVEQWRRIASALPSCDGLTRASLEAESTVEPDALDTPETCRQLALDCPAISEEAETFIDQYCALVDPCCAEEELGNDCKFLAIEAARAGAYDAQAAARCLSRLEEESAADDFCSRLPLTPAFSYWAPAVSECADVFGPDAAVGAGTARPGDPCDFDDDCAPSETGQARCVRSFSEDTLVSSCAETVRGDVGDACLGSEVVFRDGKYFDWVSDATATANAVCYRADGLYCDSASVTCMPVGVAGDACSSTTECEEQTFCAGGICTPRLEPGMACSMALGECADGSYCSDTGVCERLLGAGEACEAADPFACQSRGCLEGVCTAPLEPLCGRR